MCDQYHDHQFTEPIVAFHHIDRLGMVWYCRRRVCTQCELVDCEYECSTDNHDRYRIIWDAVQRAKARHTPPKARLAYLRHVQEME